LYYVPDYFFSSLAIFKQRWIFVRGWINIWGGGVLLLALAGAWWQRQEKPREKFNKICFLGLHGE
jgi:hypothetical protein